MQRRVLGCAFWQKSEIIKIYKYTLHIFTSGEDLELSELLADSEDFESEDFDSPDFSWAFEAAPSPELSVDELSGFFPA